MRFLERALAAASAAGNLASAAATAVADRVPDGVRERVTVNISSIKTMAADAMKRSPRFSEVDEQQAAAAMMLVGLGLRNEDGSYRPLTKEEAVQYAEIVLAATLADDDETAAA